MNYLNNANISTIKFAYNKTYFTIACRTSAIYTSYEVCLPILDGNSYIFVFVSSYMMQKNERVILEGYIISNRKSTLQVMPLTFVSTNISQPPASSLQ